MSKQFVPIPMEGRSLDRDVNLLLPCTKNIIQKKHSLNLIKIDKKKKQNHPLPNRSLSHQLAKNLGRILLERTTELKPFKTLVSFDHLGGIWIKPFWEFCRSGTPGASPPPYNKRDPVIPFPYEKPQGVVGLGSREWVGVPGPWGALEFSEKTSNNHCGSINYIDHPWNWAIWKGKNTFQHHWFL